jgi:hypothetical protein
MSKVEVKQMSNKIAKRSLITTAAVIGLVAIGRCITLEHVKSVLVGLIIGATIGMFGIAISRM